MAEEDTMEVLILQMELRELLESEQCLFGSFTTTKLDWDYMNLLNIEMDSVLKYNFEQVQILEKQLEKRKSLLKAMQLFQRQNILWHKSFAKWKEQNFRDDTINDPHHMPKLLFYITLIDVGVLLVLIIFANLHE